MLNVPEFRWLQPLNDFWVRWIYSQKLKATYGYDDPERINWHFIPRERNGVGLWDLDGAAMEDAANELVKIRPDC